MESVKFARYKFYLRQRPVMLVVLTLLAVVAFSVVTGLSRAHQAQRQAIGDRWFNRGVTDLNAGRFDAAVTDFRAALLYSRDDFSYQLNLAEALLGQGRWGQASAYLLNLWDREPENGIVNLELARISVRRGEKDPAVRYYHNAIYAAWRNDEEWRRRGARLELIELLLQMNAKAQAQSELIALGENAGEEATDQERIGDLFQRVNDYEHALAAYRTSLRSNRHNPKALAGAGNAAFELGRYPLAVRYLQLAVAGNPNDLTSLDRLKAAQLVMELDPFQQQLSVAHRNRIVVEAFAVAGQRLKSCRRTPSGPPESGTDRSPLSDDWTSLKPQITHEGLKRNPDLVETAMNLVFRIERETEIVCGTPSGADLALLMISKLHEGS